jgi:hypothetical protein
VLAKGIGTAFCWVCLPIVMSSFDLNANKNNGNEPIVHGTKNKTKRK